MTSSKQRKVLVGVTIVGGTCGVLHGTINQYLIQIGLGNSGTQKFEVPPSSLGTTRSEVNKTGDLKTITNLENQITNLTRANQELALEHMNFRFTLPNQMRKMAATFDMYADSASAPDRVINLDGGAIATMVDIKAVARDAGYNVDEFAKTMESIMTGHPTVELYREAARELYALAQQKPKKPSS